MHDAPPLGWWQASDGQWYPPELHPNHRRHAPPPTPEGRLFEAARTVEPTHRRPGVGTYTVKPVTRPKTGVSVALMTIGVILGSVVLVGGVVLAALQLS